MFRYATPLKRSKEFISGMRDASTSGDAAPKHLEGRSAAPFGTLALMSELPVTRPEWLQSLHRCRIDHWKSAVTLISIEVTQRSSGLQLEESVGGW